jgi:uncharacterized heparinase superfamily protein
MSRVSVAERTKLSVFLARGLVRKLTSRVTTHPIVNWPFSFGKADRVVIAPQDLRTTDSTRAAEIYAGRFVFAGKVILCDSRSPFEITGCATCVPRSPASPAPMRVRWSTNGSPSTARATPSPGAPMWSRGA